MHRARRISLAFVLVCLVAPLGIAPGAGAAEARDYIVVLEDDTRDARGLATDHARRFGAQVSSTYTRTIKGYAAKISADRLAAVASDPRVKYVEPDRTAHVFAQVIPWGIEKVGADISPTALAGDGTGAVTNVNVYVIDTGVAKNHPDLNVVQHVNFAGGKNRDCHGHGTHVAGTIAARDDDHGVVGVVPGAPVTGVKVLGCRGGGRYSEVIRGIDWVTAHAVKPAVANMSLGGPTSRAMDEAVRRSAASGVFYAVAAGNEARSACNSSPARAGAGLDNGIATVAATSIADQEANFSNFGACVDIWAPGVDVLSTRKGGGTKSLSGTSMASPHVAGGGALKLATEPLLTPTAIESALKHAADPTGTSSKNGSAIERENVSLF